MYKKTSQDGHLFRSQSFGAACLRNGSPSLLTWFLPPLIQQKEALHRLWQMDRGPVGHRPGGLRVLPEAGAERRPPEEGKAGKVLFDTCPSGAASGWGRGFWETSVPPPTPSRPLLGEADA